MKKSEYETSLKTWEKEYLASLSISSSDSSGRGNSNSNPRHLPSHIYIEGSKELSEYLEIIKKIEKFKNLKDDEIAMLALGKLATIANVK